MAPKRKEIPSSPLRQVKKTKKDPVAEKLSAQLSEVVAALHQANIESDVAKMLATIVPLSLGEFSEQRHPFQKQVVEGVAKILGEVEAELKKEVSEKQSQRDEVAAEKPSREKEAADAEDKLNAKIAEVQSAKVALAEKAMAFRAARTALAEAEEAKVVDGQKSQEAEKLKGDFEAALDKLRTLKAAVPEDAEGRKRNSELMALLKKHKFEESMLVALPPALAKAPEARGQFDAMAIGQLESEIDKKVAEQQQILSAAIPGQEKCEAAIKEAKERLDAARGEQRVAAKAFDDLSKGQADCSEASTAAQKAVRDLTRSVKKLDGALRDAEVAVEIFEQGPRDAFKELSERVAPPPQAEEEEAAAPMDESAVETKELEVPVAVAA